MIAPRRAGRPGAPGHAFPPADERELAGCPLCEGREERTPPELLALGPAGRKPDGPGWWVRVVPNLYPALERQEVVVHTPRHARSLAELSDGELARVAEAWRLRAARTEGYVHALVNEGAEAGSSLPHSHSQLAWLPETPPAVREELAASAGGCPLCRRPSEELVITERDGVVLSAAWAGRLPYELLVAPAEHETDPWGSRGLAAALALAAEGLRHLHAVEGLCPANVWLHAAGHWHMEVLPRLTVMAGLELGAGWYVNTLAPEEAAGRLRAAG